MSPIVLQQSRLDVCWTCVARCMDEQTDERTNSQTNRQTDEGRDGRTDRRTNGLLGKWTNRRTVSRVNG